jgi:hypothetical protein
MLTITQSDGRDNLLNISFQLPHGKYSNKPCVGTITVCPAPYCNCSIIRAEITLDDEGTKTLQFGLDIFGEQAAETDGSSPESYHFARALVKNLTNNDWGQLNDAFYDMKHKISEDPSIEGMPIEQMTPSHEQKKVIAYNEFFPHAMPFNMTRDASKRLIADVIDLYCTNPHCGCDNITLEFFSTTEDDDLLYDEIDSTVTVSYNTGEIVTSHREPHAKLDPLELFAQLKLEYPDVLERFRKRHETIKKIYEKREELTSTQKQDLSTEKPINQIKVGRNDPCPCGSGKKYKKCCITGKE